MDLSLSYRSWERGGLYCSNCFYLPSRCRYKIGNGKTVSTLCSSSIVTHPKSLPSSLSCLSFFLAISFNFSVSSLLSNFVLPILLLPDFFLVLIICFSSFHLSSHPSSHLSYHLSSHLSSRLASMLSSQLYSQLSSQLSSYNSFFYLIFRLF
jgi:hypothetical protein